MTGATPIPAARGQVSPPPIFRVQGLCFLDWGPIDLAIDAGEIVALSGASGSGKSMLLRACADLDPHRGNLFLTENDTEREAREFTAPRWRRRVGLLPAESQWWHDIVGDHYNGDVATPWLETLGFTTETLRWPVARLSTGERQRLSLLRTLSVRPRVLLLDEPTASLDPENVAAVEALIELYRIEEGAAILWVSHDPQQRVRVATRRYVMEDGGLREEGAE